MEEGSQRLRKQAAATESREAGKARELLSKVVSQSDALLQGLTLVQSNIKTQAAAILRQPPKATDVSSQEGSPVRLAVPSYL